MTFSRCLGSFHRRLWASLILLRVSGVIAFLRRVFLPLAPLIGPSPSLKLDRHHRAVLRRQEPLRLGELLATSTPSSSLREAEGKVTQDCTRVQTSQYAKLQKVTWSQQMVVGEYSYNLRV